MSKPPDRTTGAPRVRFPLAWKVILWLALNVVFLVAVAALIAQAHLRLGPESLLAGSAGERLQALAEKLGDELNARPSAEWENVLQQHAAAHRVQIALFRNDGTPLAGDIAPLPPEVLAKLGERGPRGGPERAGAPPPATIGAGPGVVPKFILRSGSPRTYWIGLRARIPDYSEHPPLPTTVMIATRWLGSGGLLFDFQPWLFAGAGVLAASVLFWFPLVRGITRAIGRMTEVAGHIAQGNFDAPLETRRSDELGRLGTSLNHMAGRLREFVTGQKRFLGDIAHELCSPLARMEMALGVLEQRADEKQRSHVEDVREEVRHMSALVNELLSFSKAGVRGREVERRAVPLVALAREVIARESRNGASIAVEIDPALAVLAEPELLQRAVANVVRNAVRYAGDAGPIRLAASTRGDDVLLTIADCGPGVPEAALHRLFDAFFRPEAARTRETGGAGLGLAIVKTCVEACGGSVAARPAEPHGLAIELRLRRAG
jgi:two-component system sensor histidine kinase CpxA